MSRYVFIAIIILTWSCSENAEESPVDFLEFQIEDGALVQFSSPDSTTEECESDFSHTRVAALYRRAPDEFFTITVWKNERMFPPIDCILDFEKTSSYILTHTVSYDENHFIDYIFTDANGEFNVEVTTLSEGIRLKASFAGMMIGMTPRSKNPLEQDFEPSPFDTVMVKEGKFSVLIK